MGPGAAWPFFSTETISRSPDDTALGASDRARFCVAPQALTLSATLHCNRSSGGCLLGGEAMSAKNTSPPLMSGEDRVPPGGVRGVKKTLGLWTNTGKGQNVLVIGQVTADTLLLQGGVGPGWGRLESQKSVCFHPPENRLGLGVRHQAIGLYGRSSSIPRSPGSAMQSSNRSSR